MVTKATETAPVSDQPTINIPEVELNWSTVAISEVHQKSYRLEASVFDIEGRNAHETLEKSNWPLKTICGSNGLATAYHRPRFKRIFVDRSEYPIYQPSQINSIRPRPHLWISDLTPTDIDALRVNKNQILLTCSGTIGNCTIVGGTLDKAIFSHDLIRITTKDKTYTGYIYAYLKTRIGSLIITTNNYGAVISHIEPEHLDNVPIPDPDPLLRNNINSLIMESVKALDKSNNLIDQAEGLLITELKLPPIEEIMPKSFDKAVAMQNFQVSLSQIESRLNGSFHAPINNAIETLIKTSAKEVTTTDDKRISSEVFYPTRFKRVYVAEGQGAPFFGGKNLYELDPSNKKYISQGVHAEIIENFLKVHKDTILITRSGTIGKVVLVPKHWDNWIVSDDLIRVIPANSDIAGYLFLWLSSDYGRQLIARHSYGAVVRHIEGFHVAQVPIPLLKNKGTQEEINDLVLKANQFRSNAYENEQEAIKMVNKMVLHL